MPYFLWSTDLVTGNKLIDVDHKKLTLLVDALIAVSERGASVSTVSMQLDILGSFAKDHFDREDAKMRKIGYCDRKLHLAEHARLLAEVKALKTKIEQGQEVSQGHIYNLLRVWLRNHIVQFDIPLIAAENSQELHAAGLPRCQAPGLIQGD